MDGSRVRVGLLLDAFAVPAWAAAVIDGLIETDAAELAVVVTAAEPSVRRNTNCASSGAARGGRRWLEALLDEVHRRFVEKPLKVGDARAMQDVSKRLSQTPVISTQFDVDVDAGTFIVGEIAPIECLALDALIDLCSLEPRGALAGAARHGVWSIDRAGGDAGQGRPPGFWESLRAAPVTRVALRRLACEPGGDRVLRATALSTDTRSAANNVARFHWKAAALTTRAVIVLARAGPEALVGASDQSAPLAELEPNRASAGPAGFAKLVAGKYGRKLRRKKYKKRFYEQWRLLYAFDAAGATAALAHYQALVPPPDRFWADPFVVQKDGRYHLFIEDYPYATKRGHIAVITLDANGRHTDTHPVLSKPYHLSYPFVFARGDDYFMIPETRQNRSIELYRCVDFPKRWVFERTLMTGVAAVDVTPFEYGDKWWLFACIEDPCDGSTHDDLYLFYADDLLTDRWQAHPHNPIVSDCRQARPAGKVFFEGGRLYRVSQDCSVRYGYGFNLVEITALNEQRYAETLISKITPEQQAGILGAHTFNKTGSLQVSDALYPREHCS